MQVINPDKYIRLAYKNALNSFAPGVPIWEKRVPIGTTPPPLYYLISTQTKNETERSKDGYEWMCSIVIECVSIQGAGNASSIPINDLEEKLLSAVETGIEVSGFDVKETVFVDSVSLDIDGDTDSIYRRVVTYQHWLNMKTTT